MAERAEKLRKQSTEMPPLFSEIVFFKRQRSFNTIVASLEALVLSENVFPVSFKGLFMHSHET